MKTNQLPSWVVLLCFATAPLVWTQWEKLESLSPTSNVNSSRPEELDHYLYISPEERELSLEERELKASDYGDLYSAIKDLYNRQRRAGHFNKKLGQWESFIQIIEDGKTVEYAVLKKGETEPIVHLGEVPTEELESAELVFIQNVARARRPARPGSKQPRADENAPVMMWLVPDIIKTQIPDELWLEWDGGGGRRWWLMFNPFAIWPQRQGQSVDRQPYALTFSRSDGRIYQREMNKLENLRDVLSFVTELNRSQGLRGEQLFRLSINGWYYSDAADAPKAGASQSQAHAHLIRFTFPIEHARLSEPRHIGPVQISTLADGWGTGLVLEASRDSFDSLVRSVFQAISLITEKGHSFNILATPRSDDGLRIFIADRTLGTPDPYFTNEWAFSEFGRAVIIDAPNKFYQMGQDQEAIFENLSREEQVPWTRTQRENGALRVINPTLREHAIESLKKVTAPQDEIDAIVQRLTGGIPDVGSEYTETTRKLRQRLIELARDWRSFQGSGRERRLKELQALCLEILGLKHLYEFKPTKPVRAVIAASGLGKRMGEALSGPKSLYPIDGEPILLHLLRTFAPFDQEPVIVVELGERYRERWERPGTWGLVNESVLEQDPYEKIQDVVSQAGFKATYLGQNELKGEGHAVLQAQRLLREFDGNLLITWGDMASLHGETVLTLLMVKEASDKLGMDVPFIIGTTLIETTVKEEAYAPVIRNLGGVVLGSQKGLKLPMGQLGEDDAGVFVGDAREIFRALMEYPFVEEEGKILYINPYNQEQNPQGEMNTAQISAIFAQEGKEAMALPIARVEEAKGVNDTHEAELALAHRQRFEEEAIAKIAQAKDVNAVADLLAVMPMSEGVVRGVLERLRRIISQSQDDGQGQAALETIAAKLRGFGNGAMADQFLQILSSFHSPTQLQTAL